MAISPLDPDRTAGTPGAVLAAARAEVGALTDRLASGWSDAEIVAGIEAAQRLKATLAAWEAMALAEADARDLARKRLNYGSTADWYTHCAGVHRREGHRAVRNAKALTTDYAATWDSMQAGQTSPIQAGVICDAVDQLPTSPMVRAKGEAFLITQSRSLTATELARAGRHLAHVVDPDRTERVLEAALEREERAAHLQRFLSVVEDGMGGVRIKGRCSVEDGETLRTALLSWTKPDPVGPGEPADVGAESCEAIRDPRDHGARMLDAMVRLAQHALDSDVLPDSHGARPRVAVTIPLDDLQRPGAHATQCETDTGLEISPATVRRWACDADLIPICLGSKATVLDVGRTVRLVTTSLWTALVCRDRHCAFPACTRPPVMTQAHHIVHWADGGSTSLDNLVLLCGEHHRTVHHTPWQVRLSAHDQRPEFLPPPRHTSGADAGGAPGRWIRHRPRLE